MTVALPDNCADDQLLVLRGHNRWIVARTDRDGVDREDAQRTTGAFLARILGPASPPGTRSIFEVLSVTNDSTRFVIGAARPVDVSAVQPQNPSQANDLLLPGTSDTLISLEPNCPVRRTIRAQVPWFVDVQFDWRAPDVRIPWPRRAVSDAGLGDNEANNGLDFLLLAAYFGGDARESDTDILDEMSQEARDAAKRALRGVSPVLLASLLGAAAGAGLLGYALWRFRK